MVRDTEVALVALPGYRVSKRPSFFLVFLAEPQEKLLLNLINVSSGRNYRVNIPPDRCKIINTFLRAGKLCNEGDRILQTSSRRPGSFELYRLKVITLAVVKGKSDFAPWRVELLQIIVQLLADPLAI